jgi:16S rRNA (cytidine1402-2'-O)-methyltransferase
LNIASTLREAAAAAAAGQQYPRAALYVVATPIGNLADLTLRAIHVLTLVDALACEDTRIGAALLRHLALDKPLLALHEHNEREAAAAVLERLARDERVAYTSDAGTPAVSDPGARLVAAVRAAGHRVVPVPGVSSVTAALSASGDAMPRGFSFIGFIAARGGERQAALRRIADDPRTQVVFEAPHRVARLAEALAAVDPARSVTVCRELTKQFEAIATLSTAELPQWFASDPNRSRGEFVLVVHGTDRPASRDEVPHDAERTLAALLDAGLALKQAVALAATLTGAPRNALYDRALVLRRAAPG